LTSQVRAFETELCRPLEQRAAFLLRQLLPATAPVGGGGGDAVGGTGSGSTPPPPERPESSKRWQAAARAGLAIERAKSGDASALEHWQGTVALAQSLRKRAALLRRHPTSGKLPQVRARLIVPRHPLATPSRRCFSPSHPCRCRRPCSLSMARLPRLCSTL
jgi:hypothetical protein